MTHLHGQTTDERSRYTQQQNNTEAHTHTHTHTDTPHHTDSILSCLHVNRWSRLSSHPSQYYYLYPPLGVEEYTGEWSECETLLFLHLYSHHPPDNGWGLFSINIPGRTGQQCEAFYKQLLSEGRVHKLGSEEERVSDPYPFDYQSWHNTVTCHGLRGGRRGDKEKDVSVSVSVPLLSRHRVIAPDHETAATLGAAHDKKSLKPSHTPAHTHLHAHLHPHPHPHSPTQSRLVNHRHKRRREGKRRRVSVNNSPASLVRRVQSQSSLFPDKSALSAHQQLLTSTQYNIPTTSTLVTQTPMEHISAACLPLYRCVALYQLHLHRLSLFYAAECSRLSKIEESAVAADSSHASVSIKSNNTVYPNDRIRQLTSLVENIRYELQVAHEIDLQMVRVS